MWLRGYRLLVLLVLVWLIRNHHGRMLERALPIGLAEVVPLLPAAAHLRPAPADRGGTIVSDRAGNTVGYALRTMPLCRDVLGYAGTSDLLIVLALGIEPEDRRYARDARAAHGELNPVADRVVLSLA